MTHETEPSELLAAYVAGGLSEEDRARVERRAAAEPAFAAQLEDLMALDLSLKQSAGVDAVLAGLEDRLAAAVEAARPVTRFAVHPLVRRAAVATAACLLLGTAGYFASTAMDEGKLPLWESRRSYRTVGAGQAQSNLREVGLAPNLSSNENKGQSQQSGTRVVTNDARFDLGYFRSSGPDADFSGRDSVYRFDNAGAVSAEDFIASRDRWVKENPGFVPDFSDAPNFNLQSTRGATVGGDAGGGGGLLGGKNAPLTDPYAPGSTIKPFKPSESTIVSGKAMAGRELSGVMSNQRAGQGQDGQNVLHANGHAEFRQTPLSGTQNDNINTRNGRDPASADDSVLKLDIRKSLKRRVDEPTDTKGLVQQPELQVTETRNGVSVPNGGTVMLGGQTLAMGDADTDAGGRANNAPATQPTAVVVDARKIIRSGEMVFEIDRFDSAAATIGKIVTENGGLVATTNSDKLPNGKVRGSIIVRIPPDKLDTFILQLRALGDLKSQRLGSADVTKEYYDLASELRAARAMEERLLEMIKSGKGEIKDLLEAEKELANWRGKIEKIIGQTKYYDNLVSLATLTITLQERDIATPAASVESESITSGIETDDVEKARAQAMEILKDAKARVISSNLNKLDAGQVASTIVADIPPDNSGAVVDRIKQLGKVARLEVAKSMSADANSATAAAPRTERKDARLTLSLYNVANVQPRVSTSIELASGDAAAAYNALAGKVIKAGGRVVKGGAAQPRGSAGQADGVFEVPADAAEGFLAEIKAAGDVISLSTAESPDTANVTTSKRGFTVSITPAANLPPRRTANLRIETPDVEAASANLQATLLAAGGRVLDASNATDPTGQSIARVVMDVPLAKAGDLLAAAKGLGTVRAITSGENAAAPAGSLAKARLEVTFATPGPLVSEEGGLAANLRHGLSISARGLVFSAKMIVVGLCFVLPWAVVLWAGLKLFKRRRTAPAT